jgi:hypothetical protein
MGIQGIALTFLFGFLFVFFKKVLKGFYEKISKGPIMFNGKEFKSLYNGLVYSKCYLFLFHIALIKYIKLYCNKNLTSRYSLMY